MQFRRRIATFVAAATLFAGVGVVLGSSPASAHGAIMQPGSRTYLCWLDSVTDNGQALPVNPACKAALAKSGYAAIYNWFAVLRGDGAGRTDGFIPDGKLCSGDTKIYDFSGFDLARDDWPVTHLTAGEDFSWKYNNWAPHPGTFKMFVTKDSWSPTRPLAWKDLEAEPFLSVTNPEQTGGAGSPENFYHWSGKLPQDKAGRHIIYTTWTRSDSAETFYNCSDVVFDGGTGAVTGISKTGTPTPAPSTPAPAPSTPAPGPSTPSSPGVPTPGPTMATPVPTASMPGPIPSGSAMAARCAATYQTTTTWPGGFQGQVVLRNTGTTPISDWSTDWMFDQAQPITHIWSATFVQEASHVSVSPTYYTRTIAPGKSATFGFLGSGAPPALTISPMCITP